MADAFDRDRRLNAQYVDSANLEARAALHAAYGAGGVPWFPWVFDRLLRLGGPRVLELGAGPGWLWRHNAERIPSRWEVVVTDRSAGMLAEARAELEGLPGFSFERVDAQDLPFPEGGFDVVVANHMLYHVPDLDRALAEIRRVLRPGGSLMAATNGTGHMAELGEVARRAFPPQLAREADRTREMTRFTLESGAERLGRFFEAVERVDASSRLVVPDAAPLVAYLASVGGVHERLAALSDAERTALLEDAERRVAGWIEAKGPVRITRSTGLLVAR